GELHPLGVLVSLDVFGVMAWQRPVDLAHTWQDIPTMARFCDVLSPMIYPSHFFGMDGYDKPGDAPEHFISASMERFRKVTAGSDVVLRPWLQAFGWRTKTYSPEYVRIQARIADEKGGIGFLFWNARADYSKPFLAMAEIRATIGKSARRNSTPPHRDAKSPAVGPVAASPAAQVGVPQPAASMSTSKTESPAGNP
ncbi:MAG: putative glycoside hydrolase, partial [Terriglobales bacterium]